MGRYLLGERLGAGGTASVYLALLRGPLDFERLVALKVVHEHLTELPTFVSTFLDEANVAVRLTHPNVVHSYELGREGPHLFLAMEYLAGQPLSSLLERAREKGEKLPTGLLAWIGARALDGLGYAHAFADDSGRPLGLVHRDVSPENVFLTYDGRVLVIDWGIARAEGMVAHTGIGRVKGKSRYMAPEQMLKEPVDHRADLFALGATLYEATVGVAPFEDEDARVRMLLDEQAPAPSSRVPSFPVDLSTTLLRALRREPRDRHANAAEMARELDRHVEASHLSTPAAALGALLYRLFAEERDARAKSVAALRGSPRSLVARMPEGAMKTADPMSSTVRPSPAQSQPHGALVTLAAAALAVGGLVFAFAGRERAAQDSPTVTTAPRMAASPAPPAARPAPPPEVTSEVDGPRAAAPPVAAPSARPAMATAPPSSVVPPSPRSTSPRPPPSVEPGAATSGQRPAAPVAPKQKGSLVTEYPF